MLYCGSGALPDVDGAGRRALHIIRPPEREAPHVIIAVIAVIAVIAAVTVGWYSRG